MFHYVLASHRSSKWPVLVSLTGQCVGFAFVLLIPLIYTESLLPVPWEKISLPPVPIPAAPKPTREERAEAVSPSHTPRNVFTPPRSVPRSIASVIDEPDPIPLHRGAVGASDGIATQPRTAPLGDLLSAAILPPPAPVEKPKRIERVAGPLPVSGGVQAAKIIRRVIPVYPELAKGARISGTVRLVGIIGKDGSIQNLRVLSGHPLLVNAAVDAVRQWLYKPTLLSGEPVEVIAPIDVNFNLN